MAWLALTVGLVAWLFARPARSEGTDSAADEPNISSLSLLSMGYSWSLLTPDERRVEYWKPLAANLEVSAVSEFELIYSNGSSARGSTGRLHIEVNGDRVHTIALPRETVAMQSVRVPLGVQGPAPAGIHVAIIYDPRGSDFDCSETDDRSVTIHESSTLHLVTQLRPAAENLLELPYPFAYARADDPIPLEVWLPPDPSAERTRAAAFALRGLGLLSGGVPLQIRPFDPEHAGTKVNRLVLATPSELATVGEQLHLPLKGLKRVPSGGAHVSVILAKPGDSTATLIISAEDDEMLARAASTFGAPQIELRGTTSPLSTLAADWSTTDPWANEKVTFSDLGLGELRVVGSGTLRRTLYVARPSGWRVTEGSRLALHFSTSGTLAVNSSVAVKLNGVNLGIVRWRKETDYWHELEIPPDPDLDRDAHGRLATHFVLELEFGQSPKREPENDCDPILANVWSLVHADSYFALKTGQHAYPDLSVLPFPIASTRAQPQLIYYAARQHPHALFTALGFAYSLGHHGQPQSFEHFGFAPIPDELASAIEAPTLVVGLAPEHPLHLDLRTTIPDFDDQALEDRRVVGLEPIVARVQSLTPPTSKHQLIVADATSDGFRRLSASWSRLPRGARALIDRDGKIAGHSDFTAADATIESIVEKVDKIRAYEFRTSEIVLGVLCLVALMAWWATRRRLVDIQKGRDIDDFHDDYDN